MRTNMLLSHIDIFVSSGKSSRIQRHIQFEVSKVMVVPRDQSSKSLESFDQQKVWLKPMVFFGGSRDPRSPARSHCCLAVSCQKGCHGKNKPKFWESDSELIGFPGLQHNLYNVGRTRINDRFGDLGDGLLLFYPHCTNTV